jgi:sortase A
MPTVAVKRRRSPIRATLRFVAAVMTLSGVLLLTDAGLTLAWQEPISAVIGWQAQSELEGELEARAPGQAPAGDDLSPAELRELADDYEQRLATGEAFGRIELPTLDREYVMVEGTDEASLRKGPGRYPDTALPGQGGTTAVAGHRTTYLAPFRTINELEGGERIVLDLPYARLTYEVQKQRIVEPTQTEVVRDVGYERLVLSACHPLYSAEQRIIIFARLEQVEPA